MNNKSIVIGIYSHPEAYPPTLNAINHLASRYKKVVVVCRNTLPTHWKYPANVTLVFSTKYFFNYEIENISTFKKLFYFFQFTLLLWSNCRKTKAETLLCYDAIPLMAAYLLKKKRLLTCSLWYHNHDTINIQKCKKYSLLWFASRAEQKAFKYIQLFTLPAAERISYFSLNNFKGEPVIIPNYPSLHIFKQQVTPTIPDKEIKLVYQGSLGPYHGFEEIIPLLNKKVNGKSLSLTLIGKMRPGFKEKLEQMAIYHNSLERLFFVPLQPYVNLPAITSQYHIGLATHRPYNVTYSTGGTASNKIFEYAACGLPVILYDHDNYRKYLKKYNWTFFTNLETKSIVDNIKEIDNNFSFLSESARSSFLKELNFEIGFEQNIFNSINQ
jgi:glycosyltransferase involved in cell wall biosynthesis